MGNKIDKPIFHLNLKAIWFDMIFSGIKKEEYREIKPSWSRVLDGVSIKIKGKYYHPTDVVICFSNGYAKDRRSFFIECVGMNVSIGNVEWGAEEGVRYYVIKLGNIING